MTPEAHKDRKDRRKLAYTDFDYIHFVIPDINGIPRGQVIPRNFVKEKLQTGLQLMCGALLCGPKSEIHQDMEIFQTGRNGTWVPEPPTLLATPWSDHHTRRTGTVMCHLAGEGEGEGLDTRHLAKRLLDKLCTDHGLLLKAAFEYEFTVYNKEDGRPLGTSHGQFLDLRSVQPDLDVVLELREELEGAGLRVSALAPELDPGQWELTLEPQDGLLAADLAFHVKNAVKIFFRRRGYEATFMTAPETGPCPVVSTSHFNHSLWAADGRNVMKDVTKDDAISDMALRWNAGLLRHAPAMTALCCPTANCERRFGFEVACMDRAVWAVETRSTVNRFKVANGNVFLESRISTGPVNPYLAVVAHLIAGMDGLAQEMTSPPPMDKKHAQKIPRTLEEALQALEEDDVMLKGLGHKFVKNYVSVKRHYDMEPFKEMASKSDEEKLQYERTKYFSAL